MTIESGRSRQISELQSDAAGVVAQAEHKELDAALDRAIWALDLARAMGDVKEGNFERWEKVAAELRTRYPKP